MPLSDDLYQAAKPIWDAQLAHPFVRQLGDGTLEVERFTRWVRQDYRYLKEFARIFAWAVAKSDRLESMAWSATVLDLTLNTEMALHKSYCARFGITERELEETQASPTTLAYTRFLLSTAYHGSFAELSTSLLPCQWGYWEIGEHLAGTQAELDTA